MKYSTHTLIISVVFSIFLFNSCQNKKSERVITNEKSLSTHINEPFMLDNIIDSSGKQVKIVLNPKGITVIDFWFNECAACINEMKQFRGMLSSKKDVKIISISINSFPLWKETISKHEGSFSFLDAQVPNWELYNLSSKEDPKLKNAISTDRLTEITDKYGITFFPAYFVLDKDGKIIARPESIVKYVSDRKH